MTHVQRPPTTIVATTLANNDATLRCDLTDFMPDLPENSYAGSKVGQQLLAIALL